MESYDCVAGFGDVCGIYIGRFWVVNFLCFSFAFAKKLHARRSNQVSGFDINK